jgi:signal transduction histidine kinase
MNNYAKLAHDLVTPLTMIKINCDQLRSQVQQKEILGSIIRIDEGIGEMVDLLNSKITNKRPTIYRSTAVTEIKKMLNLANPQLARHKIILSQDFQDDYFLQNNQFEFKRVFTNLLSNAQEALFDQEGLRRIAIQTSRIPEGFVLSISDNGKGIDAIELQRIFDYGYTTKKHGRGIGLYNVRELLFQSFNAFITCNSKVGIGTSFEILFLDGK